MASSDFLPFASAGNANVLAQADYAALAALVLGFTAGTAPSIAVNKVLRQSSFMAAVLGQLIVGLSGQSQPDDGDLAGAVQRLTTGLAAGTTNEASVRAAADTNLSNALAAEAATRAGADGSLSAALSNEAAIRAQQDGILNNSVNDLYNRVSANLASILAEQNVRASQDANLNTALIAEATARAAADASEANTRLQQDGLLAPWNLFAGGAQQNGCIFIPLVINGALDPAMRLCIQWGRSGTTTGNMDIIPFYANFPNRCLVVVPSEANAVGWGSNPISPTIFGTTLRDNASFYLSGVRLVGGSPVFTASITAGWIAVGY